MQQEFLTIPELCELLKIKRHTVYAWIKEDRIKAHRFGKLIRFEKSEVDRFIQDSKEDNSKEAA
jgi:excisionase family DNA binding protein